MANSNVELVWRAHLGNDGPSDADGWATVVELALLVPLLGLGSSTVGAVADSHLTPIDPRLGLLADAVFGLVLGVRVGGIALERHVSVLSMHAIAAALYPFIAVGLPLAAFLIGTTITRRIDAAATAALAFGAAVLVDYGLVGTTVIPVEVLLHRLGLVLALGLIAGGAAKRASRATLLNDLIGTGFGLWLLLLATTLFGWI